MRTKKNGSTKLVGTKEKRVSWSKGRRYVSKVRVYANKKTGEVFERSSESGFNFGGLLKIVAILLLAASAFSYFTGASEKTFYSLLVMLQDVPDVIPFDKMLEYLSLDNFILNLPDWLQWTKPILTITNGFLTILAFVVKGIISALTLGLYFLKWLFI